MSDERPIIDSQALKSMSPEEVSIALSEGRLDLLGRGVDLQRGEKLSLPQWRDVIGNMSETEIKSATDAGLLAPLEKLAENAPARGNADQGARSGGVAFPNTEAGQRARLRSMSPEAVAAELKAGKLDDLIGGRL